MKPIEKTVYELVSPYAKENNINIYDVIYEKRGKDMYLSIYIEKDVGITIEDCEQLNNYIEPILDEQLDINQQYYLEVSSAGLEKNIRNEEHLNRFINNTIHINLFKSIDKNKEFEGILKWYTDDEILLIIDNKEYNFKRNEISSIKSVYDWNNEGGN